MEKFNLIAKLNLVMSEAHSLEPTGENTFAKYQYAKESDVLAVLKPLFKKYKLFITHSIKDVKRTESQNAKGNKEVYYDILVEYCILDSEDYQPDGISRGLYLTAAGSGTDSGDKGLYKALTGAHKYFLSKNFNLSTGDDPENEKEDKSKYNQNVFTPPTKGLEYNPNFVVPVGKNKGKKISELTLVDLQGLAEWMEMKLRDGGKPGVGWLEFLDQASLKSQGGDA